MNVPPRLRAIIGKSDLGRSLRTKEQADAKRLLLVRLEEAQSILAAAEAQLARGGAQLASYPITQAEADAEREDDRFWREFDAKDEAKDEAAVGVSEGIQFMSRTWAREAPDQGFDVH